MVECATIVELIDALAEDEFGRYHDDFDGRESFRCPRCEPESGVSAGHAYVAADEPLRWYCGSCRTFGTRFELERLVLEDAVALDRLMMAVSS